MVVERYYYDAYGKTTVCDDAWAQRTDNLSAHANEIRYAGYMFDAETGNYLARNRYYSVTYSTWISRDPIGYRGGINLYEYCGDSPIGLIDPSGTDFGTTRCDLNLGIPIITYHKLAEIGSYKCPAAIA